MTNYVNGTFKRLNLTNFVGVVNCMLENPTSSRTQFGSVIATMRCHFRNENFLEFIKHVRRVYVYADNERVL